MLLTNTQMNFHANNISLKPLVLGVYQLLLFALTD